MKPEELLQQHDLDALLVTTPENVRYLSGFSAPQDARVILTQEGALLLTDGRYTVQAREESRIPYQILGRHELLEALKTHLKGRVGFEAAHLPYAAYERYKTAIPAEWVPTHGLIETLRLRKTPEEIEKIRAAAALADQAFEHILPQIQPGVREIDSDTLTLGVQVPLPASTPKGVSIDFYGKVWVVDMGKSAFRVDPDTLTFDVFDQLVGPYTYSDMTGWGLSNVTFPPG